MISSFKYKIHSNYLSLLKKLKLTETINYVSGNDFLPPPLSRREEEYYISSIDKPESRNILIERNLRLVVYIAKKFDNTNIAIDDLVSIGSIGLIKAINTFKSDKKIKLATYASRCIENEILMYLRKTLSRKNEVSFDEPLNIDWDGNELLLGDILGSDDDSVDKRLEQEVEIDLLNCALNTLGEREKQIMQMRYGIGGYREKTQKEVADMLGISQSYISRLEKRILLQLKKYIMKKI